MAVISRGNRGNWTNIKEALNIFGDAYIQELSKQLLQLDKVASGKLLRSLDYKVIQDLEDNFKVIIIAQDYLKFIDSGRKAGKMPPPKSLLSWIEDRRIRFVNKNGKGFMKKEQTAFIIARSIGKKGIRPTNILKITLGNVLNLRSKVIANGAKLDFEYLVNSIMLDLKQ